MQVLVDLALADADSAEFKIIRCNFELERTHDSVVANIALFHENIPLYKLNSDFVNMISRRRADSQRTAVAISLGPSNLWRCKVQKKSLATPLSASNSSTFFDTSGVS